MEEAWMEIFAPEIKEEKIRAAVNAIIRYSHGDVDAAIRSVVEEYDMTPDDVKAILRKKEPVAV